MVVLEFDMHTEEAVQQRTGRGLARTEGSILGQITWRFHTFFPSTTLLGGL